MTSYNNFDIEWIIERGEDYSKLPRDKDGYCVYIGDLLLFNKGIEKLPEKLRVLGNLDCSNNRLTAIPNNLQVYGSFDCSYNKIVAVYDNFYVQYDFNCQYNNIVLLSKTYFSGNLDCSDNKLTHLPENLKVKYNLRCVTNELISLSNGLKVDGDVCCRCNHITKIHDSVVIMGKLDCCYCKIDTLIRAEIGDIYMDDEQQINYYNPSIKNYVRSNKIKKLLGKEITKERIWFVDIVADQYVYEPDQVVSKRNAMNSVGIPMNKRSGFSRWANKIGRFDIFNDNKWSKFTTIEEPDVVKLSMEEMWNEYVKEKDICLI